jgi:hypothetical protein
VEQHALREEAKQYDIFVSTLLKSLFPLKYNDVSVVVSGMMLPFEEELRLPSLTYGGVVVIEGNVEAVNRVLRGVYYYASIPSGDQAIFTVNITDQPLLQCSSSLALSSVLAHDMPTSYFLSPSQPLPVPLITPNSSLCHTTSLRTNTVSKHVPIYIQAINQAPKVILTRNVFNSSIGIRTPVPIVQVFDIGKTNILFPCQCMT